MCRLEDFSSYRICDTHRKLLMDELDYWHLTYQSGARQVLDIGAGCGETVAFYLKHGAEKVVAVEANATCHTNLVHNFKDDPHVHIVPRIVLDQIKIDIDGSEENMLVETHWPHEWRETWRDKQSETRLYQLLKKP